MSRLIFCLLTIYLTFPCLAGNSGVSLEAKLEAERRGTHCEYVPAGGGAQAAANSLNLFAAAMQPPADDKHKWFISVVSMRQCPQCEQLKRDFASAPALRPYVNKANYRESWSHYNEFLIEDQLQGWRFEKLKLKSFPTIILQPPLDGRFGEPTNYLPPIVGYDGNPQKLAATIRERIREYVEGYDRGEVREANGRFQRRERADDDRQQNQQNRRNQNLDPPFDVLPPDEGSDSDYSLPGESPESALRFFLNQLPLPFTQEEFMLTMALAAAVIFLFVREYRKETGQQLLVPDAVATRLESRVGIDDATIVKIVQTIRALDGVKNTPPSTPSAG